MSTATETTSKDDLIYSAIGRLTTLATLPEVTAKIIQTVEDPRSSANQLHQLVSHDPALVTRVLKVVNSSFYGLPGQIGSIERAIVLLGLNAVKNIAVAASLGQLFRGVKLCAGYSAKDLWRHCIAVAVSARDLAERSGHEHADEAFLAGMIHDVGLLVSLQVWPEQLREVCEKIQKEGGAFIDLEDSIIGVDHQALGKALAERWHFPRSCQMVAGYHHRPTSCDAAEKKLVGLIYVADTLCAQEGMGFTLTGVSQDPYEVPLEEFGILASDVESTRAALPELINRAASFLM
ncbi:MAG: HDOD domain-containing protein [Phycisphaerae bacterium]